MTDEELFARAMRDVTPLKGNQGKILAEKNPLVEVADEEAEAYRALEALVQGKVQFHLEGEGDECVEGRVEGVTKGIMRKLRRGQFAIQDYLDLHGMVRTDARAALERFIENSAQQGKRSVLIVHGRGLNSERKIPVLKRGVVKWLTRGNLARWTLAFCSARPVDGGAGATYVLLRNRAPQRNSRKPPRLTLDAEWYFDA